MGPFEVAIAALVMGAATVIFAPIARGYARRMENRGTGIPREVAARLERMEQSIEAIALEIERISEGQRFTTKLLSDRSATPGSALPPSERRP